MDSTTVELVAPSLIDAIPLILIFVVCPVWLLVLLFKYSAFQKGIKILLVPVCLVAPFGFSLLWPLLIKFSGLIYVGGPGDHSPPYLWVATQLFGQFSEYVWATLTVLVIFGIHRVARQ